MKKHLFFLSVVNLWALWLAITPTMAQLTNPPLTACGMPAGGNIRQSATWTLTADCTMTSQFIISPNVTLTINGAGHRIIGNPDRRTAFQGPVDTVVNFNQITLDNNDVVRSAFIYVTTLNANQVTFTNGNAGGVVNMEMGSLSNVLFVNNWSFAYGPGAHASGLFIAPNGSITLNNVVFRGNLLGTAPLHLRSGASATATGCLTFSGNAPWNVYTEAGTTWTDNSTGPCTGTIGNGGQAETTVPVVAPCGLPPGGILDDDATFTLTAECTLSTDLIIGENVAVTIHGNTHRISGPTATRSSMSRLPVR